MSYILDALKKADAEREREGVPSLHTQHTQHGDAGEAPTTERGASPRLPWLLGGLLGGAVLVLGGWWALSPSEPVSVAVAPAQTPAPTPSPALPPQASPQPVAPPMAPPVTAQTPPQVVQAPPAAMPPLAQPGTQPTPPERKSSPRGGEGNALHVDASLRDAPARVVPVSELPEDVRRDLPALNVGGAMHSDVPANRMLILNGGVFHEGDQPAPGLVLEEIKLKSAVFRFKGHRYSVAY